MTPAMKFGAVCAWAAAAFMVFIAFGSTQVSKTQDYGARFGSIRECYDSMQSYSGPVRVMTDNTDEVSGLLANGHFFHCKTKSTGTEGSFVQGVYTASK